jgi:hypothetical protein
MFNRPFSQACENNKQPILATLQLELSGTGKVLELGSGTGQHACYFAAGLPGLKWQPTDMNDNLPGIASWRASHTGDNLLPALELVRMLAVALEPTVKALCRHA